MSNHEAVPEILFDISAPSPAQQKIVDIVTRALVGGLILMEVGEELLKEFRKYQNASKYQPAQRQSARSSVSQ